MKLHIDSSLLRFASFAVTFASVLFAGFAADVQPMVCWARMAGGESHDFCRDMALAPTGVLYLTGNLNAANFSKPEVVLLRFDSTGALLDTQASRGEEIRGVAVDAAGNYYLTGRVWSPDRLGRGKVNDLYLGKFSSAGKLVWERMLGSSGTAARRVSEGGHDVALDENGNILVVGSSSNVATFGNVTFPNTPGGPLLCKFDPDGQLLWAKRVEGRHQVFEGTILDSGGANHLALDRQGNVILTGYLYNGSTDFGGKVVKVAGPNDGDFYIAKFSSDGEVQWVQTGYGYGGLAVDWQSNIFFNGYVAGDYVMHCGALTPNGAVLWERRIPGASGAGVALTAAGAPVFVGEFNGAVNLDGHTIKAVAATDQKFFICSASADGRFRWAISDSGQAMSRASRVVTAENSRIFVAGDVRCYWRGDWICEPGQLDSFALAPQVGGITDLFLACLDDTSTLVAELKIGRTTSGLALSWPSSLAGFTLESAAAASEGPWAAVGISPVLEGARYVVAIEATETAKLFRLRKP